MGGRRLRRHRAHPHRRGRRTRGRRRHQAAHRVDARRQAHPELIDTQAWGFGDVHRAQPKVVSISNTTELGTLYTPDEIAAVCEHAHALGMTVHLDGSRLTNAAAALDVPLRALTTDAGVDVLSFGGTKIGLLYGEAIVVLNPEAASGIDYLRKTFMQLSSKMRFVSAQFEALLSGDLWLRNARQANAMGRRLAEAVKDIPGLEVPRPVQANAVFARLPKDAIARLQKRFRFYTWNEAIGEVRWMCAFDTTEADVDAFAAAIAEELHGEPPVSFS
ncbi:threonine aldolase family protein [Nonomuraea recticatena]|uniref:threonine aldolase family protein n=1 Tax=Nonomuraea recticatena TaxID=46178 RepID=UPI00360D72D1